MIRQALRVMFYRSCLPLLCGLSGVLAFQTGCASNFGDTKGSNNATVSGSTACVGLCTITSPQTIKELKVLGITEAALKRFFEDLGLKKIPPESLDNELREIAKDYLDLKTKMANLSSEDPEVTKLIQQARHAVEAVNFPLAERLLNEASQRDEQAAQNLQQVATTRFTSAAASLATNGDLQMVQLNFVEAQAYYQKALQRLPLSVKEERGRYLDSLGNSLREAGMRTKGADSQKFLRDSVAAYREALEIHTREQLPRQWSQTQNDLGNALSALGIRVGGVKGTQFLRDALAAHRAALEIRTREQLPQQWAQSQNNLGIVLSELGTRVGGGGTQFLQDALVAYCAALEIYTREQRPQDWAMTQNNLGHALSELGIRVGGVEGTQLLRDAVAAHRAALEIRTREQLPQYWASTQVSLGIVLSDLGTQVGGAEGTQFLRDAVAVYRDALEIFTQEHFPRRWEETNDALQKVLEILQRQ